MKTQNNENSMLEFSNPNMLSNKEYDYLRQLNNNPELAKKYVKFDNLKNSLDFEIGGYISKSGIKDENNGIYKLYADICSKAGIEKKSAKELIEKYENMFFIKYSIKKEDINKYNLNLNKITDLKIQGQESNESLSNKLLEQIFQGTTLSQEIKNEIQPLILSSIDGFVKTYKKFNDGDVIRFQEGIIKFIKSGNKQDPDSGMVRQVNIASRSDFLKSVLKEKPQKTNQPDQQTLINPVDQKESKESKTLNIKVNSGDGKHKLLNKINNEINNIGTFSNDEKNELNKYIDKFLDNFLQKYKNFYPGDEIEIKGNEAYIKRNNEVIFKEKIEKGLGNTDNSQQLPDKKDTTKYTPIPGKDKHHIDEFLKHKQDIDINPITGEKSEAKEGKKPIQNVEKIEYGNKHIKEMFIKFYENNKKDMFYYTKDTNGEFQKNEVFKEGKLVNENGLNLILKKIEENFVKVGLPEFSIQDIFSLILVESEGLDPLAVSPTGCRGLFQLANVAIKDMYIDRPHVFQNESFDNLIYGNKTKQGIYDLSIYGNRDKIGKKDPSRSAPVFDYNDNSILGLNYLKGISNEKHYEPSVNTIRQNKAAFKNFIMRHGTGINKFDNNIFENVYKQLISDKTFLNKYRILCRYNGDINDYGYELDHRFFYGFWILYNSESIFKNTKLTAPLASNTPAGAKDNSQDSNKNNTPDKDSADKLNTKEVKTNEILDQTLFVGDSLTVGHAKMTGQKNTLCQVSRRVSKDVSGNPSMLTTVTNYFSKPRPEIKYVSLLGGTNDIKGVDPYTLFGELKKVINKIPAGIRVVVGTIPPIDNADSKIKENIKIYNNLIKQEFGENCVDHYAQLDNGKGYFKNEFKGDGLHPKKYGGMYKEVESKLLQIASKNGTQLASN